MADDDHPEEVPRFRLSTPWPDTFAGRPSLAELGRQAEDLLDSILKLPYDPDLYRGDDRSFLAAELKAKLIPRLAVAPLGRHRDSFRQFFFGGADSDRRLWLLSNVGREGLRNDEELEAQEIRDTALRLIYEALAASVSEAYGQKAQEFTFEPGEIVEHRGRVKLGWGSSDEEKGGEG